MVGRSQSFEEFALHLAPFCEYSAIHPEPYWKLSAISAPSCLPLLQLSERRLLDPESPILTPNFTNRQRQVLHSVRIFMRP